MNAMNEKISAIGVVPVIKLNHPERDAAKLGKALSAGGVPVAEITFRAAGADTAIKLMKEACPDMLVGAGTVTTTAQIDKVIAAGGDFIVSPGFDPELVAYAQEKNIPIFPGCTTASEYQQALKFGLELIKFFPSEQSGGLAKIKALAAPFPQFKVMPTGGISLKNLADYIKAPVIAACGGSYMVTADLIDNNKWDEITELCKKSVEIVREARG
ncbi:MAG: bifunctional 4-hydroxy-2-oxoglutarate aldolase/2-dehydro-3-deoxy-phosphogluconate aldolase [Eubacteriales bacterium]|jgi:2-dehydro-3-deoxyphosphogluconate aldolase/(4S)-4-hydroxy-2-oxoglutarate aldolase|nr:bifunctional 4-hydroxy-2-oxoglutarate aldolase/2-dehydro-3-deoxy-phosphogluconate aldolase [Oscillospiraceae bacterium]